MTCLHAPGQGKVPDREGGPLLRPEGVGAIWPESRLFRAFFVLQQEVGVLYAGAQHGVRGEHCRTVCIERLPAACLP